MGDMVGLVGGFLSRSGSECPVVVLTGSRSCGKTAVLENLVPELDQRVPYAIIDCATVTAGSRELLSTLAFELNYQCGAYGRLSFPRLVTGLLVISLELDSGNAAYARGQVTAALEEYRKVDRLRRFIADLAANAIKVLAVREAPTVDAQAVDVAARYGTDLLVGGLVSGRIGRKVVLGPGQDWYGHQDRGLGRNPLDALVDLNRRASRPEAGSNRRLVAELLWAAFLADLHANFSRATGWNLNCGVLLDNADSPAGLQFLEELGRARAARRAAHPRGEPDPLTVIATSRGAIPERVLAAGRTATPLRDASYADYEQLVSTGQADRGWYPVLLPDLTEAEVGNMVASLDLRGVTDERVSPVLFRFTGGHPGAVHWIVGALTSSPDPANLASVLGAQEPRALRDVRLTNGARLLRHLTSGLGQGAIRDLTTCAAARHLDDASALAVNGELLTGSRAAQREIFAPELWVKDETGLTVMLPVLRRLLLQRLAGSPEDWSIAFEWLKRASVKAGAMSGELYYALALSEVESVTRRLAERLAELGAIDWLLLLHAVTAAPRRPASPAAAPDTTAPCEPTAVTELTTWADPRDMPAAAIGDLVAALWLLSNSLSAHDRHDLYTEAAASLEDIAPYAGAGRMVLRAEAQKYDRLAAAG